MRADQGFSAAGRSLLEMLWEELDSVIDRLIADGKPESLWTPEEPTTVTFGDGTEELLDELTDKQEIYASKEWMDRHDQAWLTYGEERGQAQGLAMAIAFITNPYNPSVPAVKQEAMERWEERQQEGAGAAKEPVHAGRPEAGDLPEESATEEAECSAGHEGDIAGGR